MWARFTVLSDTPIASAIVPVPKPRNADRDRHAPQPSDPPGVADWRNRMGGDDAKLIYKERAATAECANAQARNRGLTQFLVRKNRYHRGSLNCAHRCINNRRNRSFIRCSVMRRANTSLH